MVVPYALDRLRRSSSRNNTKLLAKYSPDLAKHKFYVWLNDYHWVPIIVLSGILYAIGGGPLVMWGIFFRVVFGLHATWLVNGRLPICGEAAASHTRDDSRNNWCVALADLR